jgi:dipeptidyl aminopeptidase/acylaminoacyl peptidase
MLRVSIRAALVLAVLLGGSARAAAPEVPAAAFAALPQVSDVVLSPDGRLLAWRDQSGSDTRVVVFDIDAKTYRRTLTVDQTMTLRSLLWADDDTLLMNVSQVQKMPSEEGARRYTFYRTMAVDVASGKSRMLLMSGGASVWVTGADLVAWHTAEPHMVVMSTYDYSTNAAGPDIGTHLTGSRSESGWVMDLFRVDTLTGKGTAIEQGDQYTDQWVVDAQGAAVARSEWRPAKKQYVIEAKTGGGWRPIFERDGAQSLTLYGLGTDEKSVIASGPGKDGWITLWAVPLDGSAAKQLSPDAPEDVVDVIGDRFSGAPVGVVLGGADPQLHWFDTAAMVRYESVAHAFPDRRVSVYSRSQDGSRLIAEVDDRSHPPIYYLVDFKSHRADIVGEAYPALDKVALGPVRSITYAARDGTAIPAYLTLPPGVAPKSLPLVVLPHGGPEAHDTPGFDWLAQFLAVRGYAVLQPQFRGSTGFGEAFRRAGEGHWGELMQNDVTDGVKAMIRQGIADPHRICIVGASYGGYAALAGVAFTPGLYACAISINGISDLPAFLGYAKSQFGAESDQMADLQRQIGTQFEQSVSDRSPVNSAADIDAPVLLLHAADDTVVPFAQSKEMAAALAGLGKPVALIKLQGEDHWLSNAATRLEVLQDTDRFLRQYLH